MHTEVDSKPVLLVTGSSGLIGTRLVEALSAEYSVAALDVRPPKKAIPGAVFINCDLTRDDSTANACDEVSLRFGCRLASVIHLAAYYDFSGKPSPLYRDLTVEGTRRLIKQLRRFSVEQFIFSSTILVMKPVEKEDAIITESSQTTAPWDYPSSKLETEQLIKEEHGAVPIVILRIAGVYDEECHSIPVAHHISRINERKLKSYFFPGNARRGQPFVHLDDLVDCLERTVRLRKELGPEEVFLIAEPDIVSYAELQDQLGELIHGVEWPTIRIPKPVAKATAWVEEQVAGDEEVFIKPWMIDFADAHYPIDITRSRERLGWDPQHRFRDTLAKIIGKLKTNPREWYRENGLPLPDHDKSKEAEAG